MPAIQDGSTPRRDAPRRLLLDLLRAALEATDGGRCVQAALTNMRFRPPVRAIAVGKAAAAMLRGARLALGELLESALLITRDGHCDDSLTADRHCRCLTAGHPLPDARSLAAGQVLLEYLTGPPPGEWLFLISGGASSLVEMPAEGVTLDDLRELNRWLLASGLPIGMVNRVRGAVSRIKAGRLRSRLTAPARVLCLSDVPGDDPAEIGSGLLCGEPLQTGALPLLPERFARLVSAVRVTAEPAAPFEVDCQVVGNNAMARAAVVAAASAHDVPAFDHGAMLAGEAEQCGERLACELTAAPPGIHVWGGETTVTLPPAPGRGGRNQTLALAAARVLRGKAGIHLLAAGTDGSDGMTDDAGALIDGFTIERGEAEGLDAADCLARADAGSFLEASGDLVYTGPTGTNVMDLVVAFKAAHPGS